MDASEVRRTQEVSFFFFFLNLEINVQQVNLLLRRTGRIYPASLLNQRGCMITGGWVGIAKGNVFGVTW